MNLKDKTVRIYGYGLFECFMSLRLKEFFGKVELFIPWKGSYPVPTKCLIGTGLPGVVKIDNFFEGLDEVDLFCFFDVGDGDLQDALRLQGHRVFGTGEAGELEYDRVKFKNVLKKVGLPVGPYQVVKGVDQLKEKLSKKENVGKFVKVSTFRGICETFQNKGIKFSQTKIDSIAMRLGPSRDVQEFIIEDMIPGKEIGTDCFVSGGKILDSVTFGMENKDKSYSCKVMKLSELPEAITKVDKALEPVYKRLDLRGMISSEVRVGKDGKPYFIDFCARAGSPPSEIICELYENIGEILWKVAEGKEVQPKVVAPFAAEILIKSEMAPTDWVPLDFKEEDLKWLKLRNLCRLGGQWYYVPQDNGTIIGAAIGFGKTEEEAQRAALEHCKLLDCEESHYDEACFEDGNGSLS